MFIKIRPNNKSRVISFPYKEKKRKNLMNYYKKTNYLINRDGGVHSLSGHFLLYFLQFPQEDVQLLLQTSICSLIVPVFSACSLSVKTLPITLSDHSILTPIFHHICLFQEHLGSNFRIGIPSRLEAPSNCSTSNTFLKDLRHLIVLKDIPLKRKTLL